MTRQNYCGLNAVFSRVCPGAPATTSRESVVLEITKKVPDLDTVLQMLTVDILRECHNVYFGNKGFAKTKPVLIVDLSAQMKQ